MPEQIEDPRPEHLRRAEIDSYRKSSQESLGWNEKLKNPNIVKKLGRKLINFVGLLSPEQQATIHHDRVIDNYASNVGVEFDEVGSMTEAEHARAKEDTIAAELESGELVESEDPNIQLEVGGFSKPGVRQLGVRDQLHRVMNPEPMPDTVRSLKLGKIRRNRANGIDDSGSKAA